MLSGSTRRRPRAVEHHRSIEPALDVIFARPHQGARARAHRWPSRQGKARPSNPPTDNMGDGSEATAGVHGPVSGGYRGDIRRRDSRTSAFTQELIDPTVP